MIKYSAIDIRIILDILIEKFADADWDSIKETRKQIKKCIDLLYKYHSEEINKKKWFIKK